MRHVIAFLAVALFTGGVTLEPEPQSFACIKRAPVCAAEQRLMCLCYESGTCVWSCRERVEIAGRE